MTQEEASPKATGPAKKPAIKATTRRTTTRKTPVAKAAAPEPVQPTAQWVRNLKNMPVHLRLRTIESDRPFFLNLKPRGEVGDAERVPAAATEAREFVDAVYGGIIEIVTRTELDQVYYPPVGYLHTETQVVRPDARSLMATPDWDGHGRPPTPERRPQAERPIASRFTPNGNTGVSVDLGSVPGMEAQPKALGDKAKVSADDMLPAGTQIFEDRPGRRQDPSIRRVTVERIKG